MSEVTSASKNYGIVLVTASSQTEAEAIAEALIQFKLAACVSFIPIRSIYTWKGEVCRDEEYQLIIKTNLDRFTDLETKVKSLHSYKVPEIIAMPIIYGTQSYLQWIAEQMEVKE